VSGNKYVLTFQDDLSKYVVAVPMARQDAETVARAFVERIVLQYGTAQGIQTDQGANFVSEVFQTPAVCLKSRKLNLPRFILSLRAVLNAVTACWPNTFAIT